MEGRCSNNMYCSRKEHIMINEVVNTYRVLSHQLQNQAVPALTNTCSALKANPSLLLFQPVDGHQPVNVRSHLFLSVQSQRKSGTKSDVFYTVVLEVMVSSAISVLRNGWGFLTFEVQLTKIASKKDGKNHPYLFQGLPLLVFGQTHSAQLNISTHLRWQRRQDTSDWFNEFPNLQAFWQRHRVAGSINFQLLGRLGDRLWCFWEMHITWNTFISNWHGSGSHLVTFHRPPSSWNRDPPEQQSL